jgi:hypothetical protein
MPGELSVEQILAPAVGTGIGDAGIDTLEQKLPDCEIVR